MTRHSLYIYALVALLCAGALPAAAAEPAHSPAEAQETAGESQPGLMDKVKGWFNKDDAAEQASAEDAAEPAKTEPAAGAAPKKATAPAQKTAAKKQAEPAPNPNATNPWLGETIIKGANKFGVQTNVQMGGGAAGGYGNE